MNKSHILIGLFLSVFLHLLLFSTFQPAKRIAGQEVLKENKKNTVAMILPDASKKQERPKVSLEPKKPHYKPAEKEPSLPKQTPQFKELFKAASLKNIKGEGDVIAGEKEDIDELPELKIDISNQEIIIGAAKYFGMKMAIVDNSGSILGEVKINSDPKVVPFEGKPSNYSNRVRILPNGYFNEKLAGFLNEKGAKIYLFVPVFVDSAFAELQKKEISQFGYRISQVKATTAQFVNNQDKYALVITGFIPKFNK